MDGRTEMDDKVFLIELTELRDLRDKLVVTQAFYDEKLRAFQESQSNVLDQIDWLKEQIEVIESDVRSRGADAYFQTGSKSPLPGIGIRVGKDVEFDKLKAINHAISHNMPNLLKLDDRSFSKYALLTMPGDVDLEVSEKVTVTIAKDLGKVLDERSDQE